MHASPHLLLAEQYSCLLDQLASEDAMELLLLRSDPGALTWSLPACTTGGNHRGHPLLIVCKQQLLLLSHAPFQDLLRQQHHLVPFLAFIPHVAGSPAPLCGFPARP